MSTDEATAADPTVDHPAAADRTAAADHPAASDHPNAADHPAASDHPAPADRTAAADHPAASDRTSADDATAIANELYRYAELIDAGQFAEVGELMEHCSFVYGPERTPGPSGSQAVADSYRSMVITYSDGTPRTRHVTTNPIISIDGDTAEVRSAYTVMQQAGDTPLQAIVGGRYRDRLHRIDGRWRFVERQFLVDLVGDLSRHLRIDLPSDIDKPSDINLPSDIDQPTSKEQRP